MRLELSEEAEARLGPLLERLRAARADLVLRVRWVGG